ncbi:hypothetical protein GCM10010377_45920 [Streptomyces viridiviolaceus]|uniref:Lipoprotein n=1 Tax=Streptomyces viridiviolaceus TaxID=68282 RepID=A0ABW2DZP7_9ACTN|nr:hypothetical protein [Streptomyces viridiviolaceus]GHB49820.1 hypothetical protein GCM10010377_45920 [Streptomyces viridiviolaceus]
MTLVTAESTASAVRTERAGSTAAPSGDRRGPRGRSRRRVRAVALAVGLAGALTLTACTDGGDSDGGDSGNGDKSPAAPSASASAETGGGTGGSPTASPGGLEGSWLATTDGRAVALVITGEQAALFATGGTVCSGTTDGARAIRLKCTDGSDDRAAGTVESVGRTSLKVNWKGGLGEETYARSEGGKLPSGLPTAMLYS